MKRLRSVRGVEFYADKDGREVVFIRYQSGGKQYSERIGVSEVKKGRNLTAAKARRKLEARRREIADARMNGEVWESPKVKAEQERAEQAKVNESRATLLFDEVAKRFLLRCAKDYATPGEIKTLVWNRLAKWWTGRQLDQATKADVRQYYLDRLERTGPFADWPREVGVRAPQTEIATLSAMYCYLDEVEGYNDLFNPCHRPTNRRKKAGAFRAYHPQRKPVVPETDQQVRAILSAKVQGEDKRELISDAHRALWTLCYYTGARPESEPCQLRHGDVRLGRDDRWGALTFASTKTGGSREIPLHPEAETALRAIMLPEPMDEDARAEWAATPIFRRRGGSEAWDRNSYRKAWGHAITFAGKTYPELKGMVLRDFRKTMRTRLTDGRVPDLTVKAIGGWSRGDVSADYYECSPTAMRKALELLTLRAQTVDRNRGPEESTQTDLAAQVAK